MGPESDQERDRERNQAAARRLKPEIDRRYPPGRWVAIEDGRVAIDAANLHDLHDQMETLGGDPGRFLVLQAGVELPEFVYILGLGPVSPR